MLFLLSMTLLCTKVLADFDCTLIPGKLKQIDAGAGQVYGVNDKDEIFQYVEKTWIQVPGQLMHVSVGPAGVWGVNKTNVVYKFHNNSWMPVTGSLKQVDAGSVGSLVGVNEKDNIFCLRRSCMLSDYLVLKFTLLEGSLMYYSCGPMGCWGVNSVKNIYYRNNVLPTACQGSHWTHISGSLEMVEVGTNGSVFGVNALGDVYKREGITKNKPMGTSWSLLDFCDTFKHVTYDEGFLWLLNKQGDIYRCSDTGSNKNKPKW